MLIEEIKKDILEMVERDQVMRYEDKIDESIDKTNTKQLKIIISQIGWPKISQVGKKVADGAWLLVQHSDYDLLFQKKCLVLIKETAREHEVDIRLIPLLEDRILVNEGKKQIYGTQFYRNKKTGKLIPKPIKDPSRVDIRRKSVGLEPIASYKRMLNATIQRIENENKKVL